jgi:hypothetical protein
MRSLLPDYYCALEQACLFSYLHHKFTGVTRILLTSFLLTSDEGKLSLRKWVNNIKFLLLYDVFAELVRSEKEVGKQFCIIPLRFCGYWKGTVCADLRVKDYRLENVIQVPTC